MTIADNIRLATSANELHPLVSKNWASPRGTCNCSKKLDDGSIVFCTLDYKHEDNHINKDVQWQAPWSPTCECGKQATHTAYIPPVFLCPECLHECMQDEDPEVQSTVTDL